MRAHSPKPPLYETALLSFLSICICLRLSAFVCTLFWRGTLCVPLKDAPWSGIRNPQATSFRILGIRNFILRQLRWGILHPGRRCNLSAPKSEEDKRATTNVQNGLAFFFFILF